ncbi:MAG: acyl-CoA dehydrogenase family protein [Deltaproteobacteria bacterium]|nr:acyl-CoA dehydrogenase family protein [Deltaproteobacteria bacterium]MBW2018870.1 acyl-CoA dehydrogenase family protein [Deltaproteobacteria bacterium]MBW2073625.1 acyl-CoA dehydrogenase family protein [Deltaproteobacteria bacterium]RLB81935.1 MAG: acyl-CoA dehydrogenase [Deltaproteobacteria bacterium]
MATYIGDTPHDLAGLDPESRQIVLDTLGLVQKRLLPKEKILELDKKEVFPEEIIRQMMGPDIGLQLLFIPEQYGGMGGGARDTCALTREMAKICLGVATAFFAIQLGADPIMFAGTEEQKEKWLGKIAHGDTLVAYAVTEPEAGSNLAALKTKAEPVQNEAGQITGYVINGNKQFISNGGYADFITVLAKAPEGPTFFIVEKGMEGFHQGKGEEKHGIRASNTSPLTFTDVFVPVENLLGGVPGNGLKQANMVFGHTRLMVAALGLGAGEAALEIVIDYAKKRIQFGSPLSEKQGYTHKLVVPNAVRLEAASAYMEEQATRLDAGEKDLQVEGSIAKYFATEAGNKTAEDAIQALGGYGYINEYVVEKIKRDVKITCIYEGTSEIQQNIISTFRWRTTIKSKGNYYGAMAQEMEALHASMPEIGAATYAWAAKALNETIMFVQNHRLTKQQYIMFCLADMMTYVEVGISMARKAKRLIQEESSQAKKIVIMSRIFANEVAEVVTNNTIKIVAGSGLGEEETRSILQEKIGYEKPFLTSYSGLIQDMDAVADLLFGRE